MVEKTVPDDVIPHGQLPPLRYRDLPDPVPLRKMLGPSIMLAGLALGSGEFIIWPHITYKSGFVFFWACALGVLTQFFLNMEIARWALATGESAVTGFIRLSKHWAWVFLILNVVPWMIPAWATGAAELVSWLIWTPELVPDAQQETMVASATTGNYVIPLLGIASMVICGVALTAGPVVYETIERIQMFLVTLIILMIVALAILMVRWDAVCALVTSTATFGYPDFVPTGIPELNALALLGALAFAGAGGTTNLGQANYVKDKGYGMGHHVGRITSVVTGQVEAVSEIGYHFPDTEDNRRRWRQWWKLANREHFLSFFLTCVCCLVLLTLISYSVFYTPEGNLRPGADAYGKGMDFILGEAHQVEAAMNGVSLGLGVTARWCFLLMGVAVLLTTEFGVLDVASRISTDIVKSGWLSGDHRWSESRLYYLFLWGMILLGSMILLVKASGVYQFDALWLIRITAAMNGGVMFLYSAMLLYMNRSKLPPGIRTSWWRVLILAWSVLFFGFFGLQVLISLFA